MKNVELTKNDSGDIFLPLSQDICKKLNLTYEDKLNLTENIDGSIFFSKVIEQDMSETELVLVETISMFRLRYAVKVPKGQSSTAVKVLELSDIKELAQCHIAETLVSYRVVSEQEVMEIGKEDFIHFNEQNFKRSINIIS